MNRSHSSCNSKEACYETKDLTPSLRLHCVQSLIRITSMSPITDGVKVPEFGPQSGGPLAGLGPENFYRLFPFHLVLDSELRVVQAGSLLQKIVPQLRAPGMRVDKVLTVSSSGDALPGHTCCITA